MKLISLFNSAVIPFAVFFIVLYGLHKRIDVFGAFIPARSISKITTSVSVS